MDSIKIGEYGEDNFHITYTDLVGAIYCKKTNTFCSTTMENAKKLQQMQISYKRRSGYKEAINFQNILDEAFSLDPSIKKLRHLHF